MLKKVLPWVNIKKLPINSYCFFKVKIKKLLLNSEKSLNFLLQIVKSKKLSLNSLKKLLQIVKSKKLLLNSSKKLLQIIKSKKLLLNTYYFFKVNIKKISLNTYNFFNINIKRLSLKKLSRISTVKFQKLSQKSLKKLSRISTVKFQKLSQKSLDRISQSKSKKLSLNMLKFLSRISWVKSKKLSLNSLNLSRIPLIKFQKLSLNTYCIFNFEYYVMFKNYIFKYYKNKTKIWFIWLEYIKIKLLFNNIFIGVSTLYTKVLNIYIKCINILNYINTFNINKWLYNLILKLNYNYVFFLINFYSFVFIKELKINFYVKLLNKNIILNNIFLQRFYWEKKMFKNISLFSLKKLNKNKDIKYVNYLNNLFLTKYVPYTFGFNIKKPISQEMRAQYFVFFNSWKFKDAKVRAYWNNRWRLLKRNKIPVMFRTKSSISRFSNYLLCKDLYTIKFKNTCKWIYKSRLNEKFVMDFYKTRLNLIELKKKNKLILSKWQKRLLIFDELKKLKKKVNFNNFFSTKINYNFSRKKIIFKTPALNSYITNIWGEYLSGKFVFKNTKIYRMPEKVYNYNLKLNYYDISILNEFKRSADWNNYNNKRIFLYKKGKVIQHFLFNFVKKNKVKLLEYNNFYNFIRDIKQRYNFRFYIRSNLEYKKNNKLNKLNKLIKGYYNYFYNILNVSPKIVNEYFKNNKNNKIRILNSKKEKKWVLSVFIFRKYAINSIYQICKWINIQCYKKYTKKNSFRFFFVYFFKSIINYLCKIGLFNINYPILQFSFFVKFIHKYINKLSRFQITYNFFKSNIIFLKYTILPRRLFKYYAKVMLIKNKRLLYLNNKEFKYLSSTFIKRLRFNPIYNFIIKCKTNILKLNISNLNIRLKLIKLLSLNCLINNLNVKTLNFNSDIKLKTRREYKKFLNKRKFVNIIDFKVFNLFFFWFFFYLNKEYLIKSKILLFFWINLSFIFNIKVNTLYIVNNNKYIVNNNTIFYYLSYFKENLAQTISFIFLLCFVLII